MKTVWDNVDYFEQLVADYAGSKYAIAVDSCTNAIFLSLQFYKRVQFKKYYYWQDCKTIDIPKRTYISVPMQVIHAGFKVNFVDHEWSGVYSLYPLPIIDSAQRFTRNMYKPGTLYCLSFHSKKILSIGRGGMILTDSVDCRDWLRAARYDGRSSIYYNDISTETVPEIGWHMYMTPPEAVRGIEQFYKTPTYNSDSGCSSDYDIDLSSIQCLV